MFRNPLPQRKQRTFLSDLNSKLQAIETRLEELAQSAALTEASASDSEKLSQISRDVAQIEYQLNQRMTAVNSKMSGIAAMDKKIDALQDGLNSVRTVFQVVHLAKKNSWNRSVRKWRNLKSRAGPYWTECSGRRSNSI